VNGELCRAIGRDAGEGGLQAGNSGPQSPPTPASDATSAAESDRSSDCWTVDGELSRECLKKGQETDGVFLPRRIPNSPKFTLCVPILTLFEFESVASPGFCFRGGHGKPSI
jgi:hypothetical protein